MIKSTENLSLVQKDLCFIDIETTGSQLAYHEIIDIGVVRTCAKAETVRQKWTRRINPRFPERLSDKARETNGFCLETWGGEPACKQLWEGFVAVVEGAVPVCHNPSFERGFISLAAAEHGIRDLKLDYHWIGTESLGWPIAKCRSLEQFSLKVLCEYFGITPEPSLHTGLNGAETCLHVYRQLMKLFVGQLTSGER